MSKKNNPNQKKGSSRKVGRNKRKIQNKGNLISQYVRNKISFDAYRKLTKV